MKRLVLLLAVLLVAAPSWAQATRRVNTEAVRVDGSSTSGVLVPEPTIADSGKVVAVDGSGTYELAAVAGTGTVTSVGNGTIGSLFSVSWATETTTPAFSLNLATAAANCVLAGPATGADAIPTCRSLVAADLGSFTISPSFKVLTLQDATGDTTPLTVRASEAPGTAHIAQFQASDNTPLSHIAHDGKFVGDVTGTASAATAAADGLTSASGTAPLTLTLAAKGLTGSVATMTGDSGSGGAAGLVPAPATGDATKYLRGDATWQTVAGGGVTNSAGANVIPKSDGTNLVASTVTDDGTVVTLNTRTTARATILTDGTGPALAVTATLPASPSATVNGVAIGITSAGSEAQDQTALLVNLAAGYTGARHSAAIVATNAAAGTGTSRDATNDIGNSNIGVFGNATATTAGANTGLVGIASGSTLNNVGVAGKAVQNGAGIENVGVMGVAQNITSPYSKMGGYFRVDSAFPAALPVVSAALVADNGVSSVSAIFLGLDNGTQVFSINDGGGVNLMREVEANTAGSGAPNALAATESNSVMTNEGSTAANYHTLPTAAKGLTFTFVVQDADGLRLVAGADDTIRVIDKVTAAAGYIESTTIGSVVTVLAINAVEWVAIQVHGAWTDGTFTYDDTSLTTP